MVTLPWYSVASSSTMGVRAGQGPHQVAQKSTRTGLSDFRTSWSKFASVTSTIPFPAIFFLLVVNVALSADAPSSGVAGPGDLYECFPRRGERTPYRNTPIGCLRRREGRKKALRAEIAKKLST